MTLTAVEVFTPSDYPSFTYVSRDEAQLERRLRDALSTPGEIVSVSGPSKSGKTVLVENVVGRDNLITITGAGIENADDVWTRVLNWMETPSSTTVTTTVGGSGQIGVQAKGEAGIPLLGKGAVQAKADGALTASRAVASTTTTRGLNQVVKEIAGSDFVLLIDDYHYMNREVQTEVAKQIKEAARLRVKICTASVPHRSDDVVRANPELRGRVRAIDLGYWSRESLVRIARLGFPALNIDLNEGAIQKFAGEASGSPQLMQAICLQACFELNARNKLPAMTTQILDEDGIRYVLEETATRTDFDSLIRKMHTGPKTRGTERKEFKLEDGSRGDVYRAVLLALADDPPQLNFPYNELSRRIQTIAKAEQPQAASIYQACSQIHTMALDMYPNQRVVEWDDSDSLLDIVDPYFLFYLRWSGKIASLGHGESL